ncbi:MAG: cation:proton antiporter [Roseofilum sp. SBFL]|uniref:cation:proton antiporter n=1 Tax=unclassified Roseofilum TaxID=2620099 RepID=UPI001B28C8AE|nr:MULTISPECIES: cation:proton antiporter [unclassified Roseofilum]MBP0014840.1 cation:proton antiporter [Roseofilum sp. SID3]MBP0023438.1 cation:proton antiporter [Roseofilum sp. SID2]MBP0041424.1 cation:proton antiporter [Roseofilum sp. SBFL]
MEGSFQITLLIILTVMAGISAQVLADFLRVPAIVFLLPFGILLGPDGLGLIDPQLLGIGIEVIVALSVALILFEGGLNLELRDLGKVSGSLRNLVTIGTLMTLVGGGICAHYLGEFPWGIAFLYASLVVVTGPTVISPLLKHVKVQRPVATLLEGEGVLIDPVGAILAVVVLDIILNGDADPISIISGLLLRLGIGGAIGALGGWGLGWFLKRSKFLSEDLKNLVVLAGLLGLFGIAQTIRSEAGLMATVVSGIVLRGSSLPEERLLRRFKGQLTMLAVSVLFILLAADLSIASIFALGWGSVWTVLMLMFVIRPLNIWVCTWTSDLNWRQKLFLGWIGPRGIVSASVASLFSILLTQRGINGGDSIKALVFLTIIMTVLCQGLTAGWFANWLHITSTKATGAVIVGISPLSRLMARLFEEQGESVVLIDTNTEACRQAEAEGLRVFVSSALNTAVLEEAGLASMGTFLAMTNNGEVNFVLAQRAVEEFDPPRVYAVFPRDSQGQQHSASPQKIAQAFSPDLPIKVWNQYVDEGKVKLGVTTLKPEGLGFQQAHLQALIRAGELVPILLSRDSRLEVMPASEEWRSGDRIIYLLHDPRPVLLKRLSGASQATRLSVERLPEVEEIPLTKGQPEKILDVVPTESKPDRVSDKQAKVG